MKKDGFNISDAPETFKRPETPPPAPPSVEPDEDLICPVCEGSGEGWTMSDSSPDAHMIQVDCGECSGSGSLHGAYQTVKTQRDYLATRVSDAGGQALFMRSELESIKAERDLLLREAEDLRMLVKEMDLMFGRTLLGMRGAVIEWQRGHGADAGMQWIWNGLEGPGELPPDEEIQAQAYFDREVVAIEEGLEEVYAYRDKRRAEKIAQGVKP